MIRTSLRAGLIVLGYTAVAAQAPLPSFDAASIKAVAPIVGPFAPGSRRVCPLTGCGGPGTGDPGHITFTTISLKSLIETAYGVKSFQIEGPDWMDSATFDVVATVPQGATREQSNLMLRNLLADRFALKLHRSTRELPVYALIVAKSGPHLTKSAGERNARPVGERGRGTIMSMGADGPRKQFEFDDFTLATFAGVLATEVNRPVIDMTGLSDKYDIRLEFAPQGNLGGLLGPVPSTTSPGGPELFTALTEQLGLKLDARKGPVEVIVVDSVSKQPTEN